MAGFFRYTVVLDACVLYPAPLRDLLLSLASAGMFAARWTETIQDEWKRNLLSNRPELKELIPRTAELMNKAIEDCLIQGYERLIDSLVLPDPDDRHVLAAAIAGHADAIVTFNLKDFPVDAVEIHGIEVLHPDDFMVAQYTLDQIKVLSAVKAMRQRLRRPAHTAQQFIAIMESQGLAQFSQLLRSAEELI
jgi:predicted nucleic acid-binding protein